MKHRSLLKSSWCLVNFFVYFELADVELERCNVRDWHYGFVAGAKGNEDEEYD